MFLKTLISLIALCFSGFFVSAQSIITVIDTIDELPIQEASILHKDTIIGKTNSAGKFIVPNRIRNIQIDKEGYPIISVQLENKPKTVRLNYDIMELAAITFKPDGDKVRKLIKEVIKQQKQNSPKSLNSYHMDNYSKFTIDKDKDAIEFFENPKTKNDSLQNESYKSAQKSLGFISERAMNFDYKKGKGEKQIVVAERIAGLRTPVYEIAALQPISYEFNEEDFNFFFKSFPNPISRTGLLKYDYKINDTIQVDHRKQIEVIFKRKKNEKPYLQGTFFIDLKDKALTKFYAERRKVGNSGAMIQFANDYETYIEADFKKIQNKWIPNYQLFRMLTESNKYRQTKDSITPHGSIVKDTIPATVEVWMNMENRFSNFTSPYKFSKDHFDGYSKEIKKNAFKKFDEIIIDYRTEPLTTREQNTYEVIDSIASDEDIGLMLTAYRFYSTGGFLDLGKVDIDLKEIVVLNNYEGARFGIQIRTNKDFHKSLKLKAGVHYGIDDKVFKYNLGYEYLLNKKNDLTLFMHFTDDIKAAGRFGSPLLRPLPYFFWRNTLSNNTLYKDHVFFEGGLQRDFFRKLTTRVSFKKGESKAIFPYSYQGSFDNTSFKQTKLNIDFKWSPKEEFLQTPIGKLPVSPKVKGPIFMFGVHSDIKAAKGEFNFSRFYVSIWHKQIIASIPFEFTLHGGKVFGKAPIWENFQGIGTSNAGGFLDRMRLGGVEAFETMKPGEFYQDLMFFGMTKAHLTKFNLGRKRIKLAASYKFGWGKMDNKSDHNLIYFKTMDNIYQEAGLEFNNILFKVLGVGMYYRFGAYANDRFQDNMSIKFTFNLN